MQEKNPLFPIFLKAHQLEILIVGGGFVGEEKLHFLLKSSPDVKVTLVSETIREEIYEMAAKHPQVVLKVKTFEESDLENINVLIAATNFPDTNIAIREAAKARNILVNVADTPAFCDFYLGGIVTKGNLKVAISTNGKSPTFAKRFRQMLEQTLPDSIPEMLDNLRVIRDKMQGDFNDKVNKLNELTSILAKQS